MDDRALVWGSHFSLCKLRRILQLQRHRNGGKSEEEIRDKDTETDGNNFHNFESYEIRKNVGEDRGLGDEERRK